MKIYIKYIMAEVNSDRYKRVLSTFIVLSK
ncbi:hypothetical protein B0H39_003267 [Clostridium beijerinckii]|jgi:hypothetical protein|nr:hypothetical protein [Clostridium beijerinckii]NOV72053.1 hypothetical protein [Clostridium beijerinckii]NOW31920.1 hypothetical protein [Clostridium beijerinckii]NOW85386.1 hypothetical protein [Clostridium beijerinckii]